ncbi:MAG: hypothetical protein KAG66_15390, partial [Methylococcales bacterium]|nr:hypothetical protein [Methylococcales bacterium]
AKAHAADIEDLVLDDSVYANFNTLLQDLTASGLQEPAQITEEVERFFDPRNYTLGGGNIGRLSLIPTSSAHRVNFYMDKLPEQYQQDTKGFLRHALVEAPIQQVEDTVLRSISGTQGQPTRELEKQFALRELRHTFRDEVGDAETAQKAMRQQLDRRINATDIRITGIEATANPSVVKINYHDPTGHIDGVLFDMQNQDTRIISRSGDAKLFTDSIYGDGGG